MIADGKVNQIYILFVRVLFQIYMIDRIADYLYMILI